MSWGNRYELTWASLDLAAIEQAAQSVVADLAGVVLEIAVHRQDWVSCYFGIPVPAAREWAEHHDDDDFEARLEASPVSNKALLPVEIEFRHFLGESKYNVAPWSEFSFDTADSANDLARGAAIEIAELLGRHFGVTCEPN